jgi:hypothetical protein
MIRVLSREPERSMLGLVACQSRRLKSCVDFVDAHFSREVAREVTQPEWPSRVPRRTNCSAMFAVCGFCCFDVDVRSGRSSTESSLIFEYHNEFRDSLNVVLVTTVRTLAPQLPPRQSWRTRDDLNIVIRRLTFDQK